MRDQRVSEPTARHENWVALRREGATLAQIARVYGVTPQAVTYATLRWAPELKGRRNNGEFPASLVIMRRQETLAQPMKPRQLSDRHQTWIDQRRAGKTLAEIAAASGVGPSAVSSMIARKAPELAGRLCQADYRISRPAGSKHPLEIREKCRLWWESGLSVQEIAVKITAGGYPLLRQGVRDMAQRYGFRAHEVV